MRGIELMLMSITALGNVTNPGDNETFIKNSYDWENSKDRFKVSLADVHSASLKEDPLPKVIRVATLETPPYSYTKKDKDGSLRGKGYAFQVLDMIASKLNITYEIVIPKSSGLGNESAGVIGLLKNKEIDMAVAFIPMMWDFTNFTRYSPILDEANIVALMLRPSESAVGSGLLAPFDTTVWIYILIALLVIGPTVFIFTSFRAYLWNETKIDKYDFTSCVWFTYGALLKQGSSITPVHDSTRLVFATWWIFITILTSFYTANLTAFLTLSEFTLPYKSINDIVRERVPWFFENDRSIDNILDNRGTNNLIGELAKSSNGRKIDNRTGVEFLKRREVFLGEKEIIQETVFNDYRQRTKKNVEQTKRCPYVTVPKTFYTIPRAFLHQKDSKIRKAFDKQLQTLIEVGIIKYLEAKELPNVNYCPLDLKNTDRQLKNSDLKLTYKVIAVGFITASLVFICEMTKRWKDVSYICARKKSFCCWSRIETSKVTPSMVLQTSRNIYAGKPSKFGPDFTQNLGNNGTPFGKVSPIYESIYGDGAPAKRMYINGRDYWLITEAKGDKRLVPIRTPSALLFQYTS